MSDVARPAPPGSAQTRRAAWLLVLVVAALAWAYTVHQVQLMDAMEARMRRDMAMSMNDMKAAWSARETALAFAMWTAMMAAMMLPGAGPMIAAFATINRRRRARGAPAVGTGIFLAGYVAVWAGFSLVATALQGALQASGLLTPMMQSASWFLSAALFLAAGAYQFSAPKERCLFLCRSTDGFILSEWRDGAAGALVMGLRHGLFCALCCGGLMLLLFAVAVMDLRWVAALAVLVTAEKTLPRPRFWRRALGAVLLASGLVLAVMGFVLDAPRW